MNNRRSNKRSKIKRTSSYFGYNRFKSYNTSAGPRETSLGKAVALSLAVVAAASLTMFFCSVYIPKLMDISKKSFISPTESSSTESSAQSKAESSSAESSKSSEVSKVEAQESKAEKSTEESKMEDSKAESSSEEKEAEPYLDGDVLIYKSVGYKLFDGSDENAEKYAEALNSITSTLDSSINVYSIVVPTHGKLTLGELQEENISSESANTELIKSKLSGRITFIDAESALEEHNDEYIYYNTDENWTSLGAYYAYEAFCSEAELTPSDLANAEKAELDNFLGELITLTKTDENQSGNADLLSNPDKVEYYKLGKSFECGLWETESSGEKTVSFIKEAVSSENARDIFCYGDVSLFKAYTGKETGRKICIVKDSSGSELAPYFTENYDEVHVIDARLFDGSLTGYCYNHGITDVLFVNSINTANDSEQIDALTDMIQ